MHDSIDLSDTIVPKSDQLNADQLLAGPMTIRVTSVRLTSADQPVSIHYEGDKGKPYKPCKTMRKLLVFAWGADGGEWIGRSMTLFNEPDVKFGGATVGGIRISHLSGIERDINISLTATKGKKTQYVVKLLRITEPQQAEATKPVNVDALLSNYAAAQTAQEFSALEESRKRDWNTFRAADKLRLKNASDEALARISPAAAQLEG